MSRKDRIAERAQSLVDAGRFAGIEWQVTQDGAPFDAGKVGMSDPAGDVPMPQTPIYRIYSMTKPIVSAAAMMLFEEGKLRLTDPVADYIPGCAAPVVLEADGTQRPARTPMIVEHLFTHRAGLSYGFIPGCPVAALYRELPFARGSLENFTDVFSRLPIAFDPGSAYRYSHATDFLGRVIEVASGQRLDAFLKERVFEPLGLADTGYMVPEAKRDRVMAMFGEPDINRITAAPDGPQTLTPADVSMMYPMDDPTYVWGGHGLFSTADDYMKVAAFLTSGAAGGDQLLSPAGIRALWRNRIPASQMPLSVGADLMPGYGWGLAGRVMMDAGAFPGYSSDGEFGWAGAAATYFWVDPAKDLTGVVMTQYLGSQIQLSDIMRDAVYQGIGQLMEADYVIVGSGSAGAPLAYRLSEDGTRSVIVIEAGGTDAGPLIQMPAALSYPMNMARYDWGYRSEPEPALGGRRMAAPRGRVIGGSSSINGMVYVRGHSGDFDHWEEAGAQGWGYADVLPYFKRMEAWQSRGHGGDPAWRGANGPLHVTRGPMENPLYHAFIAAGAEAGYETTGDYNGEKQEGLGPFDATIREGRRWSAANAYLKPAMKQGKVRLVRGQAARVVMEGQRATGVALADGRVVQAKAEVILAASAFNSPQLLMLSGIGPGAHLAEHGIDVVADRPGVGANLQDHLEVYVQYECKEPVTLFSSYNLLGKARTGLQWLLGRRGLGASNHFEAGGFVRSAAGVPYPDIQFHFLPLAVRYDGSTAAKGHGFQIHCGPMRSPSRGAVTLRSADPEAAPVIRFNYMSHDQDWVDFRRAIRAVREIAHQPALAAYTGGEIQPGDERLSDAALDEFIRDESESAYHPCGTCRIGRADDPDAVVDPEGRVIGVERLRVADSSVFPRVPYGNLNAPSIMVGEKMSDHILGKAPLPRDNSRPWVNPRWQERDR